MCAATPRPRARARGRMASQTAIKARPRPPGGVSATHGGWQACEALSNPGYDAKGAAGANMNAVIGRDAHDPISGSRPFKSYLCQVVSLS